MTTTRGLLAALAALTFAATASAADVHCPASGAPQLEQELKAVTQKLLDAVATGDTRLWRECLSSQALLSGEDGHVLSKDAFLEELQPLPKGYEGRIRLVGAHFLRRGPLAVLSYDLDERETIWGQHLTQRYHTTDTWLLEGEAWHLVASQAVRTYQDPPASPAPRTVLAELVGLYALAPGVTYAVTVEAGQLYGQRSGRKREALFEELPDAFFRKGAPGRRLFVRDAQGKVTGFIDRFNGADLLWRKGAER